MMKTRQWVLNARPEDKVGLEHFRIVETTLDESLEEGQVLVQSLMFGFAPTVRNWMNESDQSYRASIPIGEPIRGPGVFKVIKSNNPLWPQGVTLMGLSSWQEYFKFVPDPVTAPVIAVPDTVAPKDALGIFGFNSLTAYVGLSEVGEPSSGETLVVSGAAGSVGSMAAQFGKQMGCRVVGIAGDEEKCRWLTQDCGIDAAINYKSQNVSEALAELCPNGVDLFFDNVGGEILQAVMDNIAKKGRVIVCGQISAYDRAGTAPGPRDMMKVVYWSVKIQGFVLGDFPHKVAEARSVIEEWQRAGVLNHREDVRQGFENLPATLLELFAGANTGTLMLRVAD
jgi:NADPH-dependent curcumin reductase CurA